MLEMIVIDDPEINCFKNVGFINTAIKYIFFKNDYQISQKYL